MLGLKMFVWVQTFGWCCQRVRAISATLLFAIPKIFLQSTNFSAIIVLQNTFCGPRYYSGFTIFFAQFLLQSKLSTSEGSSMTRVRPSNCHPTDKHPKALRTWLLCMPLAFCYLPLRQPGSKLNSAHYSYCKQVSSQASRISCCKVG